MRPRKALLTAASFSTFVICAIPALADQFNEGAAAYNSGNYAGAKAHFLKATRLKPRSWQAHYQLANTYAALRDASDARASYQQCLNCHPPADIQANCTRALSYISTNPKMNAPVAVAQPAAPRPVQMFAPKSSSRQTTGTAGGDAEAGLKPGVLAQRARIMKEAEDEITKLRAQEKEHHDELESSANQRYIMPDGNVKPMLSSEEEAQFQRELEIKAAAIRDHARRRAESIH